MTIRCPTCRTVFTIGERFAEFHDSGKPVRYACKECGGTMHFAWPHFRSLAEVDAEHRRKGAA